MIHHVPLYQPHNERDKLLEYYYHHHHHHPCVVSSRHYSPLHYYYHLILSLFHAFSHSFILFILHFALAMMKYIKEDLCRTHNSDDDDNSSYIHRNVFFLFLSLSHILCIYVTNIIVVGHKFR